MWKSVNAAKSILKKGAVGVMLTDTVYGVVCSALNKKAVERIYKLRRRDPKKPMIILIGRTADLEIFGVQLDAGAKKSANVFWPGKVSIILPLKPKNKKQMAKWRYLHRGTNALAFRLPKAGRLRRLLTKTGPLVAPSANLAGRPPARTIKEAKKYFGDEADFYVDGGEIFSKPSKLIKIEGGRAVVLRK